MKRVFIVFLAVLLGVFLASCVAEEQTPAGGGEETPGGAVHATITDIADVIAAIEENNWFSGSNTPPNDSATYTIRGVVTYFYKYYAYVVDASNNGIKLYLKNGDFRNIFEAGKLIEATGMAYGRAWDDGKEYRLYIESTDTSYINVIGDGELPEPFILPSGSELTIDEFGKYLMFTGTYQGTDTYDNYLFDNGGVTITVYKYSEMPELSQNNSYEVKGVVGQNYGYVLFVWDSNNVVATSTTE